ncbi:hypothetical protein CDD81_7169 [Ophiocordyceps australis]|uniref:Peroxisomal ATPase PEX6 n=1 Tax=Ophiocordyceps australis TaxID=1399860 RepID=A0A2C5Y3Z5_9HYPO|nr:hypothetical protein CDD81_7169 [Ophiocordyceps australis]
MPPVAILLTSSHRNVGKATLARMASADVGLHTYSMDAYDLLSEGGGSGSDVKTEALTADRIESTMKEILEKTRVLIATSNQVDQIPDGVRGIFSHEFDIGAPDEAERAVILRNVIDNHGLNLDPTINTSSIALKTAALVAGDLVDVVDRASAAKQARLEELSAKHSNEELAATVRDVQVSDAARKNFSDSIGAPKIPNVTWDDVGGLSNVKDAVAETIQLPLERPELFSKGMKKRSGILFYGPPGTGKTLLAKAIATEYSLNFFSVKGPELLNMYIGESEANVRRVFQRARDARPCVVFFDELDSVAPKRGNQGDSGGVMDRIVSQLLAELDGMSGGDDAGGVFVVGATNRPDLLDPALLRPGRFDKMLYLGVSDTHEKQLTILEALTRKFTLDPSCSLRAVAERLPFTYTGADLYALCSDAMLKAVTRQAAVVDSCVQALNAQRDAHLPAITTAYWFDHYASTVDVRVVVAEADFAAAQNELVPSVSAGELAHYDKVRATFEGVGNASENARQEASRSEVVGKSPQAEIEDQVDLREDEEAMRNGSVSKSRRSRKKGKGKGKAVAESHSQIENNAVNGSVDKGKGRADVGFQEGTVSDDDGLY